ncbi:MAG: hypothetical protein ABSB38_09285 [Dehalococcoidia bacterium]
MEISHKSDSSPVFGSPERHITKEQLKVCIYTPTCMLSGYIHCLQRQRLLDLLNNVVVGELRLGTDFLPVTEATSHNQDGTETTTQLTLINKANILFINEIEQHGEPSTEASYKLPTAREKLPIIAKLHIPPYILSGEMHCAKGHRLSDLLNTKDMFLPMTNVDIVPSSGIRQSAVFVAVNKAQIIYAEETSP